MSKIPEKYHQDIKHELQTLPITILFIGLSLYYPNKVVFGFFVCYKLIDLYIRYQSWLIQLLTPQNKSITKEEFETKKLLFYITLSIILIPSLLSDSNSVREYTTENTNINNTKNKNSKQKIDKSTPDKIFDYIYDLYVEIQHTYTTLKTLPEQNSVSETNYSDHSNKETGDNTNTETNTTELQMETNTNNQ